MQSQAVGPTVLPPSSHSILPTIYRTNINACHFADDQTRSPPIHIKVRIRQAVPNQGTGQAGPVGLSLGQRASLSLIFLFSSKDYTRKWCKQSIADEFFSSHCSFICCPIACPEHVSPCLASQGRVSNTAGGGVTLTWWLYFAAQVFLLSSLKLGFHYLSSTTCLVNTYYIHGTMLCITKIKNSEALCILSSQFWVSGWETKRN